MIDIKKVEEKFAKWLENLLENLLEDRSDDDIKFVATDSMHLLKLAWVDAWWEAIEDISEWRSVEEKPKIGERVLALYHETDELVAYVGSDGKWYEWDGEEIEHITHWKYIPDVKHMPKVVRLSS